MATFLVVFGTSEGQTEKIADRIAETIEARGHGTHTYDVDEIPDVLPVEDSDAVIVGSSIHVSKHHRAIQPFIEERREALQTLPTAFFQVSLSSVSDDPERQVEAAAYVDAILESTGWHPDRIGLFGGALRYSKYGFLKRLLMKRIAAGAELDIDTTGDHEYTDWLLRTGRGNTSCISAGMLSCLLF